MLRPSKGWSGLRGAAHGSRRRDLPLGCTLGVSPHMLAAVTGLAAILNASAVAFGVIKWLGVCYLLYLAWQTLRTHSAIEVDSAAGPVSTRRVVSTAILINLLHRKLTIFFFAFLPQFVPAGEPNATWHMLALSVVFMAITFAVFAIYSIAAAAMRNRVLARPTVLTGMRRTFAGTYVLLATRLAVQSRDLNGAADRVPARGRAARGRAIRARDGPATGGLQK
ncbi:MAG: LysE family translocator [Candidatus Nanopelagicales bacterium]